MYRIFTEKTDLNFPNKTTVCFLQGRWWKLYLVFGLAMQNIFIKLLIFGRTLLASAAIAAPHIPELSVAVSNGNARVQWQGEGGVNYELQSSPDVFFRTNVSKFFIGGGAVLSEAAAFSGQTSGFWRVYAHTNSTGIGVATSGEYAGKLIHFNSSGTMTPLRAFGVNYYDALMRYMWSSNDTTFIQGFSYLQEHHIPVARVLGACFFPADWNLYFTNKAEYYRRMDYFISQAEHYGIGLILDFFWTPTTAGEIVDDAVAAGYLVPDKDFTPPNPLNIDINGLPTYAEYRRDLGRPDSGSNAFITYYTREVVCRYAGSPAIWGWEFGNEYNAVVDHPNLKATRNCRNILGGMILPNTSTNYTELPQWTGPDDLIRADVQVAKENFANTVRSIDTWRLIVSGDTKPRPSAWHNWTEHTWKVDTRAQTAQVLPVDNPSPMDTVTVHFYSGSPSSNPEVFFTDTPLTNQWLIGPYKELIDYYVTSSAAIGRPLIVGEWGAIGDGTTDDEKTTFNRLAQALIDSGVQLSLLWDFDTRNISFTNTWWMQTGRVPGYPASPKLYQISNTDSNLWSLEKANQQYGSW